MSTHERLLYRSINVLMRLMLCSPLHALFSGRVMLLEVTGRRSGRTYVVPVGYVHGRENDVCFTSGRWSVWWKNLRGGAAVTARMRGRPLRGTARVVTEGEAVVRGLDAFLLKFPGTASRYGVRLNADGRPDPEDLQAAARDGSAVMVVVETGQ